MFEVLGFMEEQVDNEPVLRPPSMDIATSVGRTNRRKLLRAYVELSAWMADFKRIHGTNFEFPFALTG